MKVTQHGQNSHGCQLTAAKFKHQADQAACWNRPRTKLQDQGWWWRRPAHWLYTARQFFGNANSDFKHPHFSTYNHLSILNRYLIVASNMNRNEPIWGTQLGHHHSQKHPRLQNSVPLLSKSFGVRSQGLTTETPENPHPAQLQKCIARVARQSNLWQSLKCTTFVGKSYATFPNSWQPSWQHQMTYASGILVRHARNLPFDSKDSGWTWINYPNDVCYSSMHRIPKVSFHSTNTKPL